MTVVDAAPIEATHIEISTLQRKAPVIGDDGIGRSVNPIHQIILGRLGEVGIEVYVDGAASNFERRITMWSEGGAEHDEERTD